VATWSEAPGRRRASHRRAPVTGPGRRRQGRSWLARLGLIGSLAGLGAAAAGVVIGVLPRTFSTAQQQQITAWEMGARWRAWTAGHIFPGTVRYQLPGSALAGARGLELTASRAGIAPQANCRAAADPSLARVLSRHGCVTVLRSTYSDATGTMAVTVGVAVFRSAAAESAAAGDLPGGKAPPAVRAVPFSHTLAARFGNPQRQLSWAAGSGPYLIMAAAGFADGRPRVPQAADAYATAEMLALARGVGQAVESGVGAQPPAPRCPGTPGC
jgi:hypothetical protein